VLVGVRRDSIDASEVRLYIDLPDHYEKVALLSSESRNAFASDQGLTDAAIQRLKAEAAKLGANGILLNGVGNYEIGATGVVVANPATHTGTFVASSQVAKQATGLAIYVPGN
jgi:hypothetical protein